MFMPITSDENEGSRALSVKAILREINSTRIETEKRVEDKEKFEEWVKGAIVKPTKDTVTAVNHAHDAAIDLLLNKRFRLYQELGKFVTPEDFPDAYEIYILKVVGATASGSPVQLHCVELRYGTVVANRFFFDTLDEARTFAYDLGKQYDATVEVLK